MSEYASDTKVSTALKPYWCCFKDADWGCVVVANSAQQAKVIFSHDNPEGIDGFKYGNFLDIRVHIRKDIQIPDCIIEPVLIDHCDDAKWTCNMWWLHDGCDRCEFGQEKRLKWEGEWEDE